MSGFRKISNVWEDNFPLLVARERARKNVFFLRIVESDSERIPCGLSRAKPIE